MFRWDHLRNQQQWLSGKVNGAAWGRIFGKQDCNRAGSLPRAVLTHARQCIVFPKQLSLSQPQSTAANHNQLQPRRGAPLIFLKSSADYREKNISHSPIDDQSGWWSPYWKSSSGNFLKFHLRTAGAQDSKITEGRRFIALKISPKRLINHFAFTN